MKNILDNVLIDFCEKILPYINEHFNNREYLLALIIREIRVNDLIYINLNCTWYLYNKTIKKWNKFDFNEILNKLYRFIDFFNNIFVTYINLQESLNKINKYRFIKISKNIADHIKNDKINKDKIYEYSYKLFSINSSI
jgi:hypothetical protein